MIRTILTGFFMLMAFPALLADSVRIDSLIATLQNSRDSSKVNVLLELATEYEYVDHQKAVEFAQNALDESVKIKFSRGEIRSNYESSLHYFLFYKSDLYFTLLTKQR